MIAISLKAPRPRISLSGALATGASFLFRPRAHSLCAHGQTTELEEYTQFKLLPCILKLRVR